MMQAYVVERKVVCGLLSALLYRTACGTRSKCL